MAAIYLSHFSASLRQIWSPRKKRRNLSWL